MSYLTSLATLVHRFSTYSSRSLIITRDFHSWSFIVIWRFRHDYSSLLEVFLTITHRFSKHSLRSLISTRRTHHDRSSSLDALVIIVHRRSTHSSRSLIVTREFYSRSLDVINDRSTLIEVVKNKLIEAREDFKRKILSRFQIKDLLVRSVSTRCESRHSNILRLRLSIYTLQHVSSHNITNILVHFIHISICSLFMLMFWHK